jgi:hypothetical protein
MIPAMNIVAWGRTAPWAEQRQIVGWVEHSETHLLIRGEAMGFAKGSTHPTGLPSWVVINRKPLR